MRTIKIVRAAPVVAACWSTGDTAFLPPPIRAQETLLLYEDRSVPDEEEAAFWRAVSHWRSEVTGNTPC